MDESGAATETLASRSLSICLILPRFEPSFFGDDYALPILPGGKAMVMMGCGLPLLAALTPAQHRVTIVDENVEPLDFAALATQFDVIGLTGMIVQRQRMVEILERLSGTRALVCVGGPFVTVEPKPFELIADVLFLGEADETWPQFLDDVVQGRDLPQRYKQATATDMSLLPTPRFDLAKTERYQSASVQFSRGCPFLCEFCDIIVIFGRKPRLKTAAQILAELETLQALGITHVFFVDDNFIGNKQQAKILLAAVVAWQKARNYPMHFSTEASVNLGDEPDLLDLMWQANFRSVFVGIESTRPASLLETRKGQNVRGDTLSARLTRIRDAGLIVQAGFIVGFDADDADVFDEHFRFIQDNGLGISIVSMLSPIPSTPLYDRLQKENRLAMSDDILWFEPKGMSRDALKQGYAALNRRLYDPAAFFDRVMAGYGSSRRFRDRLREANARRATTPGRTQIRGLLQTVQRFAKALAAERCLGTMARIYLMAYVRQRVQFGEDAWSPQQFLLLCVKHWHHYRIANQKRSYWGKSGIQTGVQDAPQGAMPMLSALKRSGVN